MFNVRWFWLVVLGINVDLAIFQPYLDLEAGDNQVLKIQVEKPAIKHALNVRYRAYVKRMDQNHTFNICFYHMLYTQ